MTAQAELSPGESGERSRMSRATHRIRGGRSSGECSGERRLRRVLPREQNREADFIIRAGRTVLALEVKSGRSSDAFPGLDEFSKALKPTRTLPSGDDGIVLDEFLAQPVEHWLA
jgi:uncharacterized protein